MKLPIFREFRKEPHPRGIKPSLPSCKVDNAVVAPNPVPAPGTAANGTNATNGTNGTNASGGGTYAALPTDTCTTRRSDMA